jgi:aminomethyltransferase
MNRTPDEPAPVSRRTALHDVHVQAGASLIDFAGWLMPLRYGSETSEHVAVRTTAGLFDLSHMGQIEIRGPAAASFLDTALVSDIANMRVGKAKYTMICQANGGVIDDLIVYRLDTSRYLVVANAANTAAVLDALRSRCAGFDAVVQDCGTDVALLAVQGPNSAAILAATSSLDLDELRYYAISAGSLCGRSVMIARTGYTSEDGFEIFCPAGEAGQIWTGLRDDGAAHGLVPAGLCCRDTLRLEAGMPLYWHELTTETTPYDAGLGRVVQLDKATYFIGRGALAQLASQIPPHKLVGLTFASRKPARAGYPVLEGV